jgi:branched-chain amino acid transport system ATP-binding protein
MLLSAHGLSRHFGGLTAVREVDFALARGEIRAIIGPNGAGKTTLVGMICGRLAASSGRIAFEGRDITRLRPWERVRRGIVYTFQITSIFANLTCFDNVALAVQRSQSWARGDWWPRGHGQLSQDVAQVLDRVGLAGRRDARAATLPYGHQRLLEVAIGLALRPKLLILDEPTEGIQPSIILEIEEAIRRIKQEMRLAVLLVEQYLEFAERLADAYVIMAKGSVVAAGATRDLHADQVKQHLAV